ncbi:MAG: radical SAM protein [Defluviitaleaceae bacterium]|nr:radical SAM protein [Defluviitaleaceae bacterium]MCL2239883.1 radical SAM protein [Defluviitaleaceae bacterium]
MSEKNMTNIVYFVFKSINQAYLYDANTNNVVSISDDAYIYLSSVRTGNDLGCDSNVLGEIAQLKSRGYLLERAIKEIRHPVSDNIEIYTGRMISMVCLQLTHACNLRCTYCTYTQNNGTQRLHANRSMHVDIAKQAVDFYHAHSIDSARAHVSFYGGEPLQEIDLMREIVAYAKKRFSGKQLSFGMTTNGTLLKGETLDFVAQNKMQVIVSIDGPKEITNANRIFANTGLGVHDTVMANLEYIEKHYPEFFNTLSINSVIDPLHDFDEYMDFFETGIISEMNKNGGIYEDITLTQKVKPEEKYMSKITYHKFIGLLHMLGRYPGVYKKHLASMEIYDNARKTEPFDVIRKIPDSTYGHPSGPCVPGVFRSFVDVDGNIYPCERISETSENTKIGHVYHGLNMDSAMAMLNIGKLTAKQCLDCWAFTLCSACIKYALDSDGALSKEVRLSRCRRIRRDAYNNLRLHALKLEMPTYSTGGA